MRTNRTIERWWASARPAAGLVAALSAAWLLLAGCAADDQPGEAPSPVVQGADVERRVAELEDVEAIREAAACYGRGHDAIFFDLGGDQAEARSILGGCFEPGVTSRVYFFGAPDPAATLAGLDGLIGFIEKFALDNHYTGARNTPGNVDVTLHGDGTATMTTSGATPHFIASGAGGVEPTVDVITARYVDRLRKGEDGLWRTYEKELRIDAVWRGSGQYPLAQGGG
jgi:SnoaL-like domain